MIYGNTEGLRDQLLSDIEKLNEMTFDRSDYLPDRLLQLLIRFTDMINREMLVYLTRDGEILAVALGSIGAVGLPEMHLRRNPDRLTGYRCIHTHPGGSAELSNVDVEALKLLRFDSMCAVGVEDGRATGISAAFLGDVQYDKLSVINYGPVKPGRIPQQLWLKEIDLAEERVAKAISGGAIVTQAERALLISTDSEDSLNELAGLTDTAGAVVMAKVLQKRSHPDPATFIGSGKAEELALVCQSLEIDLAILDDELTGTQQRHLEQILGVRVIDRTTLILDIFARRAETAEGKLQVELAQLKYMLPRLIGQGTALSRLGGGIGTRGPGETQLETDRRHIRRRIDDLSAQLAELTKQRSLRRARREKQGENVVALVGYTNAGKSTLLNALSGSSVFVEDKLFATLDPVIRKIDLPEKRSCLLVDTVGFIRKLPHQLVEAFKSTLEEALEADLLLVVSDVSCPEYAEQRDTVYSVLNDLGAQDKPTLEVLNKCDRVPSDGFISPAGTVLISAAKGIGLDELRAAIGERIANLRHEVTLLVPYTKGAALSLLHKYGEVLKEEYTNEGTQVTVLLDGPTLNRVTKMME